ncbi:SRPBCC family protein [Nocardia sp. MW-W600-9]
MARFSLDPVTDETFFDAATHTIRYDIDLDVDADLVWRGLVADKPLAWCRTLDGEYTSARPFGIGTTRRVKVAAALVLHERFFLWDEAARRHAFFVEAANLPVFRSFAEDYSVVSTPNGCRFTWRFAFEPRPRMRLPLAVSQPLNRKVLFDGFIRDTTRRFAR